MPLNLGVKRHSLPFQSNARPSGGEHHFVANSTSFSKPGHTIFLVSGNLISEHKVREPISLTREIKEIKKKPEGDLWSDVISKSSDELTITDHWRCLSIAM